MSITSRIASMEEHISNAYNGLQGLGADLTGIDKNIDNIAQVLDDIYDDMPKVTSEDTVISLNNTRVGKLSTTLKGNTSQNGTPIPSTPIPVNVVSGNNTITVCAKNLLNPSDLIAGNLSTTDGTVSYGTYRITGKFIRVKPSETYSFQYKTTSSNAQIVVYQYNASQTFTRYDVISALSGSVTLASTTNYIKERIQGDTSTQSSDVYDCQVELNSTPTTFEAYSGDGYSIDIGNNLPSGYTEVEYIESTGTQYINTGVIPASTIGVKIKASLTSENNTDKVLFGSRATSGNTRFWVDFDGSNNNHAIVYGFGSYASIGYYSVNAIYEIKFNYNGNSIISVKDEQHSMTNTPDFTSAIPIYLFRANYTSAISGSFKIYYCQIFDGTTMIRNLIPCYRNSDNEIGMYDTVNNIFYTNQGTGAFLKGNDINIRIELYKIGDYQDYIFHNIPSNTHYDNTLVEGNWYKYSNVGKVVLNGSETWGTSDKCYYTSVNSKRWIKSQSSIGLLSNRFENSSASGSSGVPLNQMFEFYNPNVVNRNVGFNYDNSEGGVNAFKTWLSSNNIILYYILATPTSTEITYQPLIDQLNALELALSKNGQTNISQVNNDLPFIISSSALKEWSEINA